MDIARRQFLMGLAGAGACCALSPFTRVAYAALPTDKRLVVVILRGGMDGLGALVPYGDSTYAAARTGLAQSKAELLDLDGFFGLNPSMKPFHDLYQQKQLIAVHAVASPYRDRSHFDAQDLLESGGAQTFAIKTGWLNRAVASLGGTTNQTLAVGSTIPLVMRGDVRVNNWSPSNNPEPDADYIASVQKLYEPDPMLHEAINASMELSATGLAGEARGQAFPAMAKSAGQFLKEPAGPRIATLEMGGWDTHNGQGAKDGRLAQNLGQLAQGILALKTAMGEAVWKHTVVVMMSEFGRTVAMNGTGGSDHGTATAAFITGGAVAGGKVLSDWPGLSQAALYDGRDLKPTRDVRGLCKGILADHMGVSTAALDSTIFPDSAASPAWRDMIV